MPPVTTNTTPLQGPAPDEVPLTNAPLVRVIAQVRFPLVTSIEKREFIAGFQEAIRAEYPALRPEQNRALVIGPEGAVEKPENRIWRFNDSTEGWRVTLAPDFLALETAQYTSRDEFVNRFAYVLRALETHVNPRVIDRLGVRYVDRVSGEDLRDLRELVQPEVAGVLGSELGSHTNHSISQTLFQLTDESGQLMARWGLLPPKTTVDPAVAEPLEDPSWLLDLDAFLLETRPFDPTEVVVQARAFCSRIYSFFRWAVTKEFLRRYGGKP